MSTTEPPVGRSGDALAAAFELVATPALFAFFGWMIDRWLGTAPLFILILTIFTAGYSIWRLFNQYETEMQAHEAARRERRSHANGAAE
ncbi:MAG: AtpZ/AtpI family protein [Acidimicrobiales bacterium]